MWQLDVPDDRHRRQHVLVILSVMTLFAIIVGTTILGIAENWPHHQRIATPRALRQPKTYTARVVAVRAVRCQAPGVQSCSIATVELGSGPDRGHETKIRFGDTGTTVQVGLGDKVLVYRNPLPPGATIGGVAAPPYAFSDFQRHGPLIWLALVFVVIVLVAGRIRGARALAGLAASLGMVVFFIVPAVSTGRPPVQVAAFGALGIMLLTIPLVHGGGAKSLAACIGTALALLLTLGLADAFTSLAHLSGLTTDQAVYLQSTTQMSIRGLLLAGMVIGSLGVLGDTTVTQASTVMALRRANPGLDWKACSATPRVSDGTTSPRRSTPSCSPTPAPRCPCSDLQPRRHFLRKRGQQ
jgi:hypothetical protein